MQCAALKIHFLGGYRLHACSPCPKELSWVLYEPCCRQQGLQSCWRVGKHIIVQVSRGNKHKRGVSRAPSGKRNPKAQLGKLREPSVNEASARQSGETWPLLTQHLFYPFSSLTSFYFLWLQGVGWKFATGNFFSIKKRRVWLHANFCPKHLLFSDKFDCALREKHSHFPLCFCGQNTSFPSLSWKDSLCSSAFVHVSLCLFVHVSLCLFKVQVCTSSFSSQPDRASFPMHTSTNVSCIFQDIKICFLLTQDQRDGLGGK